jgi:hypothetical protein
MFTLTSTPSQVAKLTIVPSEAPSSTIKLYRGDRLNITFDYPRGWYLQEAPDEPIDVLLTSYDPASPPHKLEWDDTIVSIGIRLIPPEIAPDSLDRWIEDTKQEAEEAQLAIFSEERLILETGFPTAHMIFVSGSGGILEYVLIVLNGRHFEIVVQGNFILAKPVLDTLRSSNN